ncbi:MAG: ACP S-malonyltransferase [Leptospiraceae bacterium]|nr:ACP S-malonyltransferase [Leptospiraceae bacterium]MCP5497237.1 ACP S-malonyltransferase [Leptospiraceae bacterium]
MAIPKLINEAKTNNKKLFLQFGGQGSPYLKELTKIYKDEPELKEFFDKTFETLNKLEKNNGGKSNRFISEGLDLKSWMENENSVPSEDYQMRGCISIPLIFIVQMANYLSFVQKGYSVSELLAQTAGLTGHSQGVISATIASMGKEGQDFYEVYSNFIDYMFYIGLRAQEEYPNFDVSEDVVKQVTDLGDKNPAPMVACIGYATEELEAKVQEINKENNLTGKHTIYASLYNASNSIVLSAEPSSLVLFRKKFKAEMDAKKGKFVFLKTTVPFHSPLVASSWTKFEQDLKERINFKYTGSDLKRPVYSIHDGKNLQQVENLGKELFDEMVIQTLHWDKALTELFRNSEIDTVIDFGPSVVSSKLTGGQLSDKKLEKRVVCVSNPKDLKHIYG